MIADPQYVKQLIKKRIDGTLSDKEKGQLKAARLIYTDDEWWEMISDVLLTMEQENPTLPFADGWQPNIIKRQERLERRGAFLKKWRLPIAAGIILLFSVTAWLMNNLLSPKPKPEVIGDCVNLDEAMGIPSDWFSGTIVLPDSTIIASDSLKAGQTINLSYVQLHQTDPGTLEITSVPGRVYTDSTHKAYVEIRTKAQHQYRVILPNKAIVLLNAGTTLKVSFRQLDSRCYVFLQGQALVKMPEEDADTPLLILETPNAQIQSTNGEFAVLGIPRYNQTTLIKGNLAAFTSNGSKRQIMDSPGDQLVIMTEAKLAGKTEQIVESSCRRSNMHTATAWTKAVRNYEDVPMRQFVAEMCQWYGLSIQNINCVPAAARITTAYCYHTKPQMLYAQIRAKGIALHEEHGVLTFCDPSPTEKLPWARSPAYTVVSYSGRKELINKSER